MPFALGHVIGMTTNAYLPNLFDAGRSVRAEDKRKYFGEEIVEHFAIIGIIELFAISTTGILIADTT